MRHKRAGLHLSRTAAHRKALFSNMVAALFTYERIRTTLVKAKEIRRLAERTITWARRLGTVLTKKPEKRTVEEKARLVHTMRMALRVVRDRDAVLKLFEDIGPRFLTRHGGYTRLVKMAERQGDAAPMALLELIPAEGGEVESKPTTAKGKVEKADKAEKAGGKEAGARKGKSKGAEPHQETTAETSAKQGPRSNGHDGLVGALIQPGHVLPP